MKKQYKHNILKECQDTLYAILEIINEGVWDWDAKTGLVIRSPGWYRMLDYKIDSFAEDVFTWENVIHPDDYPFVMQQFESYINGKNSTYDVEYRCKKADGSYLWIRDKGKIVERGEDGSVARMIGAHENINDKKVAQSELLNKNKLLKDGNLTLEKLLKEKNIELEEKNLELEKKIQEIELLSTTDSLTQIANRRKFESQMESEIARAVRYKHSLSFTIFDIDHFKDINDKYGHKKGDEFLYKLASFVKSHLRKNDFIARWGGEEFAVIFPETDLRDAVEISNKLCRLINQTNFIDKIFISCSFGVAELTKDETVFEFFSKADKAMYKAKKLGRNRVES